jgi:hypothetical protein
MEVSHKQTCKAVIERIIAMKQIECKTGMDGKEYQVIDDTWYHKDTPEKVIHVLENCRTAMREYRLHIYYGDMETGEAWIDPNYCTSEMDIRSAGAAGYIGKSTGNIKIPLEICNSRSYGGMALLDHCIIKIVMARGKRVLYQHANFHLKLTVEQELENRLMMVTQ